MKITKFRLNNFRGFYSTTPWFNISQNTDRNVTVIHCENGIGKTTLLNAFTWCFYGALSDDVQEKDELTNKRALKEAAIGQIVECWVEIYFEHLFKKYRVRRVIKSKKIEEPNRSVSVGQEEIFMQAVGDNGIWVSIQNSIDEIGRILPEKLHNYFFFNGERIEWIQRPIKRKEFIDAATMLVGDEIYKRSLRHLASVKQRLEERYGKIGGAKTAQLIAEKTELQQKIEALHEKIEIIDNNLIGFRKEQRIISDQLLAAGGGISKLEQKREILKDELNTISQNITDNRKKIVDYISEKGYLAFSSSAVNEFMSLIHGLKESGEIPRPYKATFVKHLLENGRCICGTELINGQLAYTVVEKWLDKVSTSNAEEMALFMEGIISELGREVPEFFSELDAKQTARIEYFSRRTVVESELLEISDDIRSSSEDEIRKWEFRLQEITSSIEDANFERGLLSKESSDLEGELEVKEKIIEKIEAKNREEEGIKRQINLCNLLMEEIGNKRVSVQNKFREDLNQRINDIFSTISFKPYRVVLEEDYSLKLVGPDGTVAKSTSESQILSLSFILALMNQARDYTATNDNLIGVNSSIYPLIMDSPFGNLGEAYQKKVSDLIPDFANQVVIFVSKSQWKGNVETVIRKRVGKEYVISYYTPKTTADEVTIDINGRSYPLVKRTSSNEVYMEFLEVTSHV